MRKWQIILLLVLLWQLEYLPIPVFCRSINVFIQNVVIFLPFITLIISIVLLVKFKKIKSLFFILLLIVAFTLDLFLADIKRTVCNYIIVYSNYYLKPQSAFNPILGVVMDKDDKSAIYNWSFTMPESDERLFYQINHGVEDSEEREQSIVINKNWYYTKLDVIF